MGTGDALSTWIMASAATATRRDPAGHAAPEGAPPHWLVYFGADDIDASACAKVEELGGTVVQPPMEIGEGNRIAVAQDPGRAAVVRALRRATSTTDPNSPGRPAYCGHVRRPSPDATGRRAHRSRSACAACGAPGSATAHGPGVAVRRPLERGRSAARPPTRRRSSPVAGAGAGPTAVGAAKAAIVGQRRQHRERELREAQLCPLSRSSLSEVEQELRQCGLAPNTNQSTLTPNLLAIAPIGAPPAVQAVINAGNEIAHLPYVWGGGHVTYEDSGYDCSGSISFVLAAAGLLKGTETSGQLMSYGDAGPGKWITIYAAQGHTFMYIAGLRFDTVALAQTGSRWSNRPANSGDGGGFVERHPVGL